MKTTTTHDGLVALLRQAHQAMSAVVDAVSSMSALPVDELAEAVSVAGGIARLTDAAMARTVTAVEEQARLADPEQALARRCGMRDAATFLATATGASRRTLKRWRDVGAATAPRGLGSCGELPPLFLHLAEALEAGAISTDQALVVREHLHQARLRAHPDDLDVAERALVAAATGADPDDACGEHDCGRQLPLTPELLAVQAQVWRDAIDPDGPEPAYEELRKQRSFTFGQRSDGMWAGRLLLPPDQGEALRLALDAHNAPRGLPRYEDETAPETGNGQPDEHGADLNRHGRLDERTTAQRQADTLVGIVTAAMTDPDAPRIGGESATLMITITEAELAEHASTGGGTAHLDQTGEPIPAHVAARLICDGYLQACLLGEDGLPLKLGRARRSHTRHQRRAILTAYPGGCQNPGCHAPPSFTEIHHPVWWSDGGRTDTDNGVPLCQHCHIEVHAGRLRCERGSDGRWYVVPSWQPRGRYLIAS